MPSPARTLAALSWLLAGCAASDADPPAPPTAAKAPQTIADMVELVNALPKPVQLPDLIATLPHPLAIQATHSVVSAQPAVGRRSPRIFVFFDGLLASIALDGVGSHLLELGELRGDDRTLKAELAFPLETGLAMDAPFERIMYSPEVTNCAFCHAAEAPDSSASTQAHAFSSRALKPNPRDRVWLTELIPELAACDAATEPARCALLHSVFDGSAPPIEHEFPETFGTFVR